MEHLGALDSLSMCLQLHTLLNLGWGLDVLDLVSQNLDTPMLCDIIERKFDLQVKVVALLEGPIEL